MGRDHTSRPARAHPDAVDLAFSHMVAPATMIDTDHLHQRRQARKLANATRQAAMQATPGELVHLRRLVDAAAAGVVTLDDARSAVAQLRRDQARRIAA